MNDRRAFLAKMLAAMGIAALPSTTKYFLPPIGGWDQRLPKQAFIKPQPVEGDIMWNEELQPFQTMAISGWYKPYPSRVLTAWVWRNGKWEKINRSYAGFR